jgi:hypothetical protein
MSAQARGGSKIEDGWEYYPVTKTFGYQEQQIIGVKDAFITYKDTVAIGEQSYSFEYIEIGRSLRTSFGSIPCLVHECTPWLHVVAYLESVQIKVFWVDRSLSATSIRNP